MAKKLTNEMNVAELIAELETYGFKCQGGPLETAEVWTRLKELVGAKEQSPIQAAEAAVVRLATFVEEKAGKISPEKLLTLTKAMKAACAGLADLWAQLLSLEEGSDV